MTEAEARVVGVSAQRIVNLRGLQAAQRGSGTLSVLTAGDTVALTLTREDIASCLALLVEREASLLLGFNVILDTPPA